MTSKLHIGEMIVGALIALLLIASSKAAGVRPVACAAHIERA